MKLVPKMLENGEQEVRDGKLVFIDEETGKEVLQDKKPEDPEQKKAEEPKKTEQYMTKQEVDALLAKVRREEKDKLYPQIERAQEKISTLETLVNSLQDQIKSSAEKGDPEKKKVVSENEELKSQLAELTSTLNQMKEEMQNQKSEAEAEKAKLKLDRYREQKLREAGAEVIPELVSGSSEAEIDESIARSRQKYREIIDAKLRADEDNKVRQDAGTPSPPPSAPPPEPPNLTDADREMIRNAKTPEQLRAVKQKIGIPLNSDKASGIAGIRSGDK